MLFPGMFKKFPGCQNHEVINVRPPQSQKVINKKIKKVGQSGVKWIIFLYFSVLLLKTVYGHIYW